MHKVGFIIPVHPPHYEFLYKFLDHVYAQQPNHDLERITIFVVFSTHYDFHHFHRKQFIEPIILDGIDLNMVYRNKSTVTIKKFYALEKLMHRTEFDYFIACDAEIGVVKENFNYTNIYNKIKHIVERKQIFGADYFCDGFNLNHHINESCAALFGPQNHEIIRSKTHNNYFAFWWSDLPFYDRSNLHDFFSKINYKNINWHHFDHNIYLCYLLLYHNFQIVDLTPFGQKISLETLDPNNDYLIQKLIDFNYSFAYVHDKFFWKHLHFLISNGSFLRFHLDR